MASSIDPSLAQQTLSASVENQQNPVDRLPEDHHSVPNDTDPDNDISYLHDISNTTGATHASTSLLASGSAEQNSSETSLAPLDAPSDDQNTSYGIDVGSSADSDATADNNTAATHPQTPTVVQRPGSGPWIVPQPTRIYSGPISDIEAFKYARYSRRRLNGGLDENIEGNVSWIKKYAARLYDALLQTDIVSDAPQPKTGNPGQGVVSIKSGYFEDDHVWLTSWKLVMDCYDIQAGVKYGGHVNKPRAPTAANKSTSVRTPTIVPTPYADFDARFAEDHRLFWYNKATCKRVLDQDLFDCQLKAVSAPVDIWPLKEKESKNNANRSTVEVARQRIQANASEEPQTSRGKKRSLQNEEVSDSFQGGSRRKLAGTSSTLSDGRYSSNQTLMNLAGRRGSGEAQVHPHLPAGTRHGSTNRMGPRQMMGPQPNATEGYRSPYRGVSSAPGQYSQQMMVPAQGGLMSNEYRYFHHHSAGPQLGNSMPAALTNGNAAYSSHGVGSYHRSVGPPMGNPIPTGLTNGTAAYSSRGVGSSSRGVLQNENTNLDLSARRSTMMSQPRSNNGVKRGGHGGLTPSVRSDQQSHNNHGMRLYPQAPINGGQNMTAPRTYRSLTAGMNQNYQPGGSNVGDSHRAITGSQSRVYATQGNSVVGLSIPRANQPHFAEGNRRPTGIANQMQRIPVASASNMLPSNTQQHAVPESSAPNTPSLDDIPTHEDLERMGGGGRKNSETLQRFLDEDQ